MLKIGRYRISHHGRLVLPPKPLRTASVLLLLVVNVLLAILPQILQINHTIIALLSVFHLIVFILQYLICFTDPGIIPNEIL